MPNTPTKLALKGKDKKDRDKQSKPKVSKIKLGSSGTLSVDTIPAIKAQSRAPDGQKAGQQAKLKEVGGALFEIDQQQGEEDELENDRSDHEMDIDEGAPPAGLGAEHVLKAPIQPSKSSLPRSTSVPPPFTSPFIKPKPTTTKPKVDTQIKLKPKPKAGNAPTDLIANVINNATVSMHQAMLAGTGTDSGPSTSTNAAASGDMSTGPNAIDHSTRSSRTVAKTYGKQKGRKAGARGSGGGRKGMMDEEEEEDGPADEVDEDQDMDDADRSDAGSNNQDVPNSEPEVEPDSDSDSAVEGEQDQDDDQEEYEDEDGFEAPKRKSFGFSELEARASGSEKVEKSDKRSKGGKARGKQDRLDTKPDEEEDEDEHIDAPEKTAKRARKKDQATEDTVDRTEIKRKDKVKDKAGNKIAMGPPAPPAPKGKSNSKLATDGVDNGDEPDLKTKAKVTAKSRALPSDDLDPEPAPKPKSKAGTKAKAKGRRDTLSSIETNGSNSSRYSSISVASALRHLPSLHSHTLSTNDELALPNSSRAASTTPTSINGIKLIPVHLEVIVKALEFAQRKGLDWFEMANELEEEGVTGVSGSGGLVLVGGVGGAEQGGELQQEEKTGKKRKRKAGSVEPVAAASTSKSDVKAGSRGKGKNAVKPQKEEVLTGAELYELYHNHLLPALKEGRPIWLAEDSNTTANGNVPDDASDL